MSEHDHQAAVFRWARMQRNVHPELRLLFHPANGGKRDKITAWKLKQEGVEAGVSDIILLSAKGPFHGLVVELKNDKPRGALSPEQRVWLADAQAAGYSAEVCYGFDDARETILNYLALGPFKT